MHQVCYVNLFTRFLYILEFAYLYFSLCPIQTENPDQDFLNSYFSISAFDQNVAKAYHQTVSIVDLITHTEGQAGGQMRGNQITR